MFWKLQEDPNWKPYCLKCSTMHRMVRLANGHFQCIVCRNVIDDDMLPVKVNS